MAGALTPAQRAFIAALVVAELRDEDLWRPGSFDLPVLRRLPELELELGDEQAATYAETPPAPAPSSTDAPDWWTVAYPGGPMVKAPALPRALYPPDSSSSGKKPSSDGPDVTAYKRTVSRAGRWPWDPAGWDDAYSNAFAHGKAGGNVADSGVAGVQRQGQLDDTGWLGEKTFNLLRSIRIPAGLPHAGEPAMDAVAVGLLEDAWQLFAGKPPGSLGDVEHAITDYLVRSIKSEPRWHYSQVRPMENLGVPPENEQRADCSTSSTDAYYWARKQTGVAVPDPNHNGYNGAGYTGTLVNNPKCSSPYKIGDLGIYGSSTGNTTHVVTCHLAGSSSSAEWTSHGSEAAPYAVELHYRGDLLCVVRPGIMP